MPRSRSSKPPLGIRVARGELGERVALRHQPLFAGLQRRSASTCSVMSLKHGEDGGLAADVTRRDDTLAQNVSPDWPLQLEAQVLGAAVPLDLVRQPAPFRRVHVVVGGVLADGIARGRCRRRATCAG